MSELVLGKEKPPTPQSRIGKDQRRERRGTIVLVEGKERKSEEEFSS